MAVPFVVGRSPATTMRGRRSREAGCALPGAPGKPSHQAATGCGAATGSRAPAASLTPTVTSAAAIGRKGAGQDERVAGLGRHLVEDHGHPAGPGATTRQA